MILKCKIIPNASRSTIKRDPQGLIKIHLNASPIDGKANKRLIDFLTGFFNIPKNSISIIAGLTSREKKLNIEYTDEYILHKLNELR